MALAAGTKLGPYEILAALGAGGMGEVYRARDTRLGRDVAIKVIPQHLSSDPELKARFEREARSISALNHPHICHLYDVGSQDGTDFLVMELVEGESLARRLEKGPLPIKQTIELGTQVAEALEKAHKSGIVHRDLKPGNIMLTKSGAKLLDFGLAKGLINTAAAGAGNTAPSFTAAPTMSGPSPASPLTSAGTIVGTIQYMSPEQVEGKEADARSDLFSLGAVLYEAVTGKRAFQGKSQISVASAILEKDPEPISTVKPMSPPALDFVVRTCLAKNPEERFQTAHDLKLQLQWIATSSSEQGAIATRTGQARNMKWLGWAAALLAAFAIWAWVLRPAALPRIVDTKDITDDGIAKSGVFITGIVPAPMVTDGSRLYFLEMLHGSFPLVQVSVNGGDTVPLVTPFTNPGPSDVSPDGSNILIFPFTSNEALEEVWSLPIPAGSPRHIGNITAQDAAWTPDASHIVYSAAHDIFLCQSDGSNCKKLVSAPGMPAWLRWSPDGKALRFSLYDSKTVSSSLWEVAADGSNLHLLLPQWNQGSTCCGTWTPDGRYFVFQAMHNERSDLWVLREHGGWPHSSSPIQLTAGPLSFAAPVPSRDGTRLFAIGSRRRGELLRYDEKSKEFVQFLGGMPGAEVAFSKDGKQIAYLAYPQQTLWRANADGSNKLQLTFAPMRALSPRWSPDGKKLLFSAILPGSPWRIYTLGANGGEPEPLTSADANEVSPDWSPKGDEVAYGGLEGFMAVDSVRQPIRILNLASGKNSAVPGSEGLRCPRWSPDGRYLAAPDNAQSKMMLFDFQSSQWQVLADFPVACPQWSANGQYLYSQAINVAKPRIFRIRMADRKIETAADLDAFTQTGFTAGGYWIGLAPDDSPMVLRDRDSEEIYSLQWQLP